MISLPSSTSIWIAAGITDMRRGFTGLSAVAQTVLEQNPYSGPQVGFELATLRLTQGRQRKGCAVILENKPR